MSDIITLSSSDEEDLPPPQKRIKPISLSEVSITLAPKKKVSTVLILSDDETEDKVYIENGQAKVDTEVSVIKENDFFTTPKEQNAISMSNGNIVDSVHNENHVGEDTENQEIDSVVIDENSSEDSSGKENQPGNGLLETDDCNEPSTSALSSTDDRILENYLKVCGDSVTNSQYEHLKEKQFPILRKYYKKCGGKLSDSASFANLIEEHITRAQKSPATAVISFNEVLLYVKEVVNAESIEVSEEQRIKLKKLEKAIKLLLMKIKQLENSEINFDAEEDSSYLQLERYTNRLNKVYKKYCQLLERNPYSGRITHEKLDFVHSEYNEINRALSKKYKNNEKFPSYYEVEQYIRKVVAEHNLDLSECKIKTESTVCFKKLGELLQARRKKDLYESHYIYIRDTEDPASADKQLDSTLRKSFTEGQIKIEKICEEFRIKEEVGEEVVLSEEDSDKSKEESSDQDDD